MDFDSAEWHAYAIELGAENVPLRDLAATGEAQSPVNCTLGSGSRWQSRFRLSNLWSRGDGATGLMISPSSEISREAHHG